MQPPRLRRRITAGLAKRTDRGRSGCEATSAVGTASLSLITCGFRRLSAAGAILRRGVGPDGAVVPRDLPVGGEGHKTFADGAMTSLLLRARSHSASSSMPL